MPRVVDSPLPLLKDDAASSRYRTRSLYQITPSSSNQVTHEKTKNRGRSPRNTDDDPQEPTPKKRSKQRTGQLPKKGISKRTQPKEPSQLKQTLPSKGRRSLSREAAHPSKPPSHSSPSVSIRAYVPNPSIFVDKIDSAHTFSIVSYNILAECHRVRTDYSYTAPEFLGQDYRHSLLMKELQYLNGDVVCLQEVSPEYFNQTLLPEMEKLGYEGLIMKRTKEDMDEGEATFYKTDIFELEISEGVSLTRVAHKAIDAATMRPAVAKAAKEYTDRPDVVLITKLRHKVAEQSFTIGNVHVIYDGFKSPDVQCLQAACAIKEVVRIAGSLDSPYILCGDFNGEPYSFVKRLVDDQEKCIAHANDLHKVQGLKLEKGPHSLFAQARGLFLHPSTSLQSTYKSVLGQEPEVTCHTDEMWTLDYIFYSANSLQAAGVLKTVDKDVIAATGGLPSRDFPSDHLSLKAVLAFSN